MNRFIAVLLGWALLGGAAPAIAADSFGPTFQCTDAAGLYQQAANAASAGEDARVVELAQQSIHAYDACKDKSTDDEIQQLAAVMMAAAFLPKDSKQKALYLYDRAHLILAAQCASYPSLDLWAKAQIIGAAEQYRSIAVPIGAPAVESCDQRWPPASPQPQPSSSRTPSSDVAHGAQHDIE